MKSMWMAGLALAMAVPATAFAGDLKTLRDKNPDPNIVEVDLVAKESKHKFKGYKRTNVYSYNGRLPGPLIRAKVGDTLIVNFTNRLPEETTVHWHGVELPANMDGSDIAQPTVASGGTFRYEFKLLRPALYWYHPHVRTNGQVEQGLYGALLVEPNDGDELEDLPDRGHVLVLDDVMLDENGQVVKPFPDDPLLNAETQHNGREGDVLLCNGRVKPTYRVRAGVPHRLRVVNASNSRFMRLSMPGQTLWRIGGDVGLLEAPELVSEIGQVDRGETPGTRSDPDPSKGLILTPGERADLVFVPTGKKNQKIALEWHDVPRGRHKASYDEDGETILLGHDHMDGHRPPETLVEFKLKKGKKKHIDADWEPPAELDDVESIDATDAPVIPVMMGHSPPDADGNLNFFVQMIAGVPYPMPLVTPQIAPSASTGDTRIIAVNNLTAGHHNFHLHGFVFQLIDTQYIDMDTPENNRTVAASTVENLDTILIPRRTGAKGRSRTVTRLKVTFDDTGREGQIVAFGKEPTATTSGGWVFHCHILEHSARGMMSFLQILD